MPAEYKTMHVVHFYSNWIDFEEEEDGMSIKLDHGSVAMARFKSIGCCGEYKEELYPCRKMRGPSATDGEFYIFDPYVVIGDNSGCIRFSNRSYIDRHTVFVDDKGLKFLKEYKKAIHALNESMDEFTYSYDLAAAKKANKILKKALSK